MKILLVYPVINSPQNSGYNYGLGYIAAVLKKAKHDVNYIIIHNNSDISLIYKQIKKIKPEMIAFSVTTSQFNYVLNISKKIKRISNAFVVYGGVHPTLNPECILETTSIDAIVIGEGEYPLVELVTALEKKINYFNIKNIWFRKKNKIIKNAVRPLIKNLDELPFPDKESLDYQKVIDKYQGTTRFIFSRGCPFECTYCCNKALSRVYPDPHNYFRQRSPKKAIEEIERDEKKYKFKSIIFDDDTISLNKKWFYEFFRLYKKKFKYKFRCNLRVGTVNADMIKLLSEAGAENIGIGIEHGNEKFRKEILKRNISNKQIIEVFELCDKYGISHHDFIMVGLPYETKELFLDTVRLCRKVLTRGDVSIFYPYAGTELGDICISNKWVHNKKYFLERHEAIITYPNFTKEEIQLCHDIFPILIKYKFIPINIFMLNIYKYLYRFLKAMKMTKIVKKIIGLQ